MTTFPSWLYGPSLQNVNAVKKKERGKRLFLEQLSDQYLFQT